MKAAVLEMGTRQARTEAERYAKCKNLTEKDKAIMAAYKSIAHGWKIIDLDETIKKAGLFDSGLPKLAFVRADAERVNLRINQWLIEYSWNTGYKNHEHRLGFHYPQSKDLTSYAIVPYVPPYIRKSNMGELFILFEAEWKQVPRRDPFLLARVDKNMYRIVGAWDVTPVEAAAIA